MKKLMCVLLIFALVFPICATAENALEKYEKILTGKWNSAGYTGVPNSASHMATVIEGFEFPGTHNVLLVDGKNMTTVTAILSGDDTGEVYLTLAGAYTTVGRVYLSSDGLFLLLICPDNSIFLFTKE